jgi:hypothetical protein
MPKQRGKEYIKESGGNHYGLYVHWLHHHICAPQSLYGAEPDGENITEYPYRDQRAVGRSL